MARQVQPEFTGGVNEDLTALAMLFRDEVQVAAGRSEPFCDGFSVGVNDGISMLVTLPWVPRSGEDGVAVGEFTISGLAQAQELLEVKYWSLDAAGIGNFAPAKLNELDRKLIALYDEAGSPDGIGSLDAGVHLRFEGDAARARWSLFIQNETLRKMACSVDGDSAAYDLFMTQSQKDPMPAVVYMQSMSPLCPLGAVVSRGILQLRAQCLDADVIIFARRGMAIRASSPDELWRFYCAIMDSIDEDVRARLRKLPWVFQGTGEMLADALVQPAENALTSCLTDGGTVRFWESSREGVLRKVLGSPELLEMIGDGFPDHRTAALGGVVPLLVRLEEGDGAKAITQRVEEAWSAYVKRYSNETPLRFGGTRHMPSVVVLAGLGVMTTLDDATDAQAAYSALAETLTVLEGARAYGGLQPIPYEEAVAIANAPARWPRAVEAVGAGPVPAARAAAEDSDTGGEADTGLGPTPGEEVTRLAPPSV